MISWFHGGETRFTTKQGQQVQKPLCVVDYNKFVGDVASVGCQYSQGQPRELQQQMFVLSTGV
jgi:hypothetical protein